MFLTAPPKCRNPVRHFGGDLGCFCLCDFVFSHFLVAKRRLSAAETKIVGGVKKLKMSFFTPLFFIIFESAFRA